MSDTVEFKVRLFAGAKQTVGADSARVVFGSPHTVDRLRLKLTSLFPQIASLIQQSRIAVNATYAGPEQILSPTDEIALIPPVSGG